jgi:hypothetical protein
LIIIFKNKEQRTKKKRIMKLFVLFTLFILGSSTKLEGWYDDKLNPMPPFEDMEEEIKNLYIEGNNTGFEELKYMIINRTMWGNDKYLYQYAKHVENKMYNMKNTIQNMEYAIEKLQEDVSNHTSSVVLLFILGWFVVVGTK